MKKQCDVCGEDGIVDIILDPFDWGPGSGEVECDGCSGRGEDEDGNTCQRCDGDGKVRCPKCGGTGWLDD